MGRKWETVFSLLTAAIFISIMAAIFSNVMGLAKSGNKSVEGLSYSMQMSELEPYNNKQVTGDAVIALIHNGRALGNGLRYYYQVDGEKYGYQSDGSYKDIEGYGNVSPLNMYTAKLHENANGVIDGIEFSVS